MDDKLTTCNLNGKSVRINSSEPEICTLCLICDRAVPVDHSNPGIQICSECRTRLKSIIYPQESRNLQRWDNVRPVEYPARYRRCGMACPDCGEELLVDTMFVLTSNPPMYRYHCEACKWHGTK